MDDQAGVMERARELGAIGCAIRIVGAVPLLPVAAVTAPFSCDALPFMMWWEWVRLRPLVLRSRRYEAETARNHGGIVVRVRGRTISPLRPTGKVRVNGITCAARSDSGWIDADMDIVVIASDAFSLIVRAEHKRLRTNVHGDSAGYTPRVGSLPRIGIGDTPWVDVMGQPLGLLLFRLGHVNFRACRGDLPGGEGMQRSRGSRLRNLG
jgi:hypothetical protein